MGIEEHNSTGAAAADVVVAAGASTVQGTEGTANSDSAVDVAAAAVDYAGVGTESVAPADSFGTSLLVAAVAAAETGDVQEQQ